MLVINWCQKCDGLLQLFLEVLGSLAVVLIIVVVLFLVFHTLFSTFFQIVFRGTKDNNETFVHEKKISRATTELQYTVEDLVPETKYEFSVYATAAVCGEGERSTITVKTAVDSKLCVSINNNNNNTIDDATSVFKKF